MSRPVPRPTPSDGYADTARAQQVEIEGIKERLDALDGRVADSARELVRLIRSTTLLAVAVLVASIIYTAARTSDRITFQRPHHGVRGIIREEISSGER